ncbi:MAG: DMT family protein [Bernardetiaceae bacterium]
MTAFWTILLLTISNAFMTLAWYGHLKFGHLPWLAKWGLVGVTLLSWGIALFEYIFQVPANRMGFVGNGGPFDLWQLKVLQEVITLIIFTLFVVFVFKMDSLRWNHGVGFLCLVLAVYFIFKP